MVAALFFDGFAVRVSVESQQNAFGGDVHHPGGHDLMLIALLSVRLQGKQVQQHLQTLPIPDIRQRELLVAGFVVHHPQVQPALVDPAVHPVGNSGQGQLLRPLAQLQRADILGLGEVQLEVQRLEIRAPQLLGGVQHHLPGVLADPMEQIEEAGGLLPKVVELLMDIFLHVALADPAHLLVADLSEAPQSGDLPGGVFQQIVVEGADLRGGKPGRLMGLGLQAVLAEVGEFAAGEAVDTGSAEPQLLAVELLHRPGAQLAPGHLGGRRQPGKALRLLSQKPGCRRPGLAPSAPQGRGRHTQGGVPGGQAQVGGADRLRRQAEDRSGPVIDVSRLHRTALGIPQGRDQA